jgi:hypothetical protein
VDGINIDAVTGKLTVYNDGTTFKGDYTVKIIIDTVANEGENRKDPVVNDFDITITFTCKSTSAVVSVGSEP